jgi:hypothetical protein
MSFETGNLFHDGDATTIDKAIASSVVAQYVKGNLQTLAGHFQTAEPNQFASWYRKWGGSKLPVEEVPGFTDRDDKQKPIKLVTFGTLDSTPKKLVRAATFEAAVHETVHLNSNPNRSFAKFFGDHYNEGVTEYFTLKVFGVTTGAAYPDELSLASGLVKAFDERTVAFAYFRDDAQALLTQVQRKFLQASRDLKNFLAWQTKSKSDNSQNWAPADALLKSVVGTSASSASGAGSGSGGGSGSGSGSAGSGSRR